MAKKVAGYPHRPTRKGDLPDIRRTRDVFVSAAPLLFTDKKLYFCVISKFIIMSQLEQYVFVSYSRKDKNHVLPLVKKLEQEASMRYWIDLQGIMGGSRFEEDIMEAISHANVVLLMISKNVNDATYVKNEIEYAQRKGKRIVPILLDDAECPEWVLFKFGGYDFIHLKDKDQYRKLLQNLQVWLGASDESGDSISESATNRKSKYWWLLLLPAIALLVVVLIKKPHHGSSPEELSLADSADYFEDHVGDDITFRMIKVEGGTFMTGDSIQTTVDTFWIGETEVTQALWEEVMGEGKNQSYAKGTNRPVEQVSYYDCLSFIEKLNIGKLRKYRLPTSAEWEFAARGGNKSNNYKYAGGDSLSLYGWYQQNCGDRLLPEPPGKREGWPKDTLIEYQCSTHVVKTKLPNELGIYDMSGNVLEWTSDRYIDSSKPNNTNEYIIRGGSWSCIAKECEINSIEHFTNNSTSASLGFRLVCD